MRWNRLGRIAMLAVLAVLLFLYLRAGVSLLSSWSEARHTSETIAGLKVQYSHLLAHHAALESPAWVESQARALGMVFPGEHQYFLRGLPHR
ncbi:MAG: hypothetical protein ACYDA6_01300 [Solirubrobacteraceae bacterium]